MNLFEKRLLVLLEEAGNEELVCLVNMATLPVIQLDCQLSHICDALRTLVTNGNCLIAPSYEAASRVQFKGSSRNSLGVLEDAIQCIVEHESESRFAWSRGGASPEVFLSERGFVEARRLKAEEDWIEGQLMQELKDRCS